MSPSLTGGREGGAALLSVRAEPAPPGGRHRHWCAPSAWRAPAAPAWPALVACSAMARPVLTLASPRVPAHRQPPVYDVGQVQQPAGACEACWRRAGRLPACPALVPQASSPAHRHATDRAPCCRAVQWRKSGSKLMRIRDSFIVPCHPAPRKCDHKNGLTPCTPAHRSGMILLVCSLPAVPFITASSDCGRAPPYNCI